REGPIPGGTRAQTRGDQGAGKPRGRWREERPSARSTGRQTTVPPQERLIPRRLSPGGHCPRGVPDGTLDTVVAVELMDSEETNEAPRTTRVLPRRAYRFASSRSRATSVSSV